MEISFTYRFEAAHRFLDSSSKCSTPHGHTWYVTLFLEHASALIQEQKNFSQDFYDLKKDWRAFIDNEMDHHFFANEKDPLLDFFSRQNLRIKTSCGDPTTEYLALALLRKAENIFKKFEGIEVSSLLLKETPTNSVRVSKRDSKFLDKLNPKDCWWN